MTHSSAGLHRFLELPSVYERFQRLLGARAARTRFVAELLRPFAGARLLDIGCGTGSLLDDLPADVQYQGFDLNASYIDAARARGDARAKFFCARVGEESDAIAAGSFDFVVAKGILHHLSDADGERLLSAAARALRHGGVFVSIDPVRHDGQSPIARLLIAADRGRNVRTAAAYEQLLRASLPDCQGLLLTDLLRVPYSHFAVRAIKR